MTAGRGWLATGAVLAAASLGLRWDGPLTGADVPARVAVVAAVTLVVVGLRSGRDQLLTAALGAVVLGVLLGGLTAQPGRVALAAAGVCLVLGGRAAGRRVLPARRARG
ncbi:hypothetical protein GCU67_06615 [Modestobacter muralis]|uniref:Uncharacterized protein n=1 Tax=Modestobacter muralis TaxID=1608614 RepID=A0A6P0H963_9ACTN|nr:hypothetical protein [Modestobacter muralis]NEK93847.1 hypothetical protein [Modestobacter muralis]NEN50614.1 hypothetical protein [Modestobacter muralis]